MKILFAIFAVALFTSALSENSDPSLNEQNTTSTDHPTTISTIEALEVNTTLAPNTTLDANTTTVDANTTTVDVNTTTLAPITTTLAPITTTLAPITTPLAPITTPAPNTTLAPNTTSEAPDTSSVTFSPVTPTSIPAPDKCSWNVTAALSDVPCIRAEMKAQFIIDNQGKKTVINLGCNATYENSDCTLNGTHVLVLSEEEYTLTMVFEKESEKFSVRNITFNFTLPDGEQGFVSDDSVKLFTAAVGNSYLCKSDTDVHLGNVTMKISEIHIQSFSEKDKNDFGKAEECDADDAVSDIIPITVGIVLVALVIVVLIAYLIGRRRSRQRGYQTFKE